MSADNAIANPSLAGTSAYWDEYARRHLTDGGGNTNRAEWLGHPLVQARERLLRGGRELSEWLIGGHLPRPVERIAGLGAGAGLFEIDLVRCGMALQCDLFEMSSGAADVGRSRAEQLGVSEQVRFHSVDINTVELEAGKYGLITFVSSLHHVGDLERVLGNVRAALAPDGRMFATEYVGPSRFAFPDEHVRLQRSLYSVLDPALKGECPDLPLPIPADVERVDPSEAVRSEEILTITRTYFDHVAITPRGGCIPFVMWWGLNHDALYETPSGLQLVDLLLGLDDACLAAGTLPTYFADLVATP